MSRFRAYLAVLVLLGLASVSYAAEPPALGVATGVVKKKATGLLFVTPRGPDGRFEKVLVLTLAGTSKVTALGTQNRGGRMVPVQRDMDIKDLQPDQSIAIIYASVDSHLMLLSAVVKPAGEK